VLGEAEKMSARDREFVNTLVHGTRAHIEEIDSLIAASSKDWKIERMATVDRNITRLATFEIRFSEEKLTPNIAINEAVELAKKYGTDDSSRYVNGILGAMMKAQ
jgi:N utilization substance protein B